jgi:hypothetical protein
MKIKKDMKHLKTFESHSKSIEGVVDIKDTIKNLHKISKENKEVALNLLNSYTKAGKGKITGLQLHTDLKKKIKEGDYPSGYDMGIDKNGYFNGIISQVILIFVLSLI